LKTAIRPLLQSLWWKDFELLADLIFTQSGWQRTSVLGKTEKSIDLELLSPVTGSTAPTPLQAGCVTPIEADDWFMLSAQN